MRERVRRSPSNAAPVTTAEEIVARKVSQFVQSRRELARQMARHFKVPMLDDVERFFDAAEAGRYEEMRDLYKTLRAKREDGTGNPDFGPQWRTVIETEGAVREARNWPAQQLLDYGEAILDSVRPGMVYVGGTDPGCCIPTMLNETSEGERHIVLTQNALADGTYLDYLNYLYGDRLATLTQDDSKRLFEEYTADARKRLEHDQQFPNEPKQIRPGENVSIADGKVQVSGFAAVMTINEKLFQLFMKKNPDASFAMEQSFPFKSTQADATPLGPVLELRVPDPQNVLTRERAAQSVEYWRSTAEKLNSDVEAADLLSPRYAYAKMAAEQASLLLARGYPAEAEQALRIANDIGPGSPEAFYYLVNMFKTQGRIDEAIAAAEAVQGSLPSVERLQPIFGDNPAQAGQFRNVIEELKRMQRNQ